MAPGAPERPFIDTKCLSPSVSGNAGARIGRPPQWTDSKSRKLARLYVHTTLPVEKIIKAIFPDDDTKVKKNSAQKTMHKMFGQDPRSLRPANRDDMNTRFKLVHKRSKRGRNGEKGTNQDVGIHEVKGEPYTLAFSDIATFSDLELRSPQQDSIYSLGSDLASPGSAFESMSPTVPMCPAHPSEDMDLPFPPPARNDTVFSTSTQMSTNSVRKLRNRLNVTTVFAKQIDVLMKRLTIGGFNPQLPNRAPLEFTTLHSGYVDQVPHPGLSLPGDFIVARKYMHQGSRHDLRWSTIADEASEESDSFYITDANEAWCDRACDVQNGTLDAASVDHFGNTPLHFFASLESDIGMKTTLHLIESKRLNPLATNMGGQTFLHVMSAAWFTNLEDLGRPLYKVLNILWTRLGEVSKAVFWRDVYGRTFFHQLARYVHDLQLFTSISQRYYFNVIPRDAFGVTPPSHIADHPFPPVTRTGTMALSSLAEETKDEALTPRDIAVRTLRQAYLDPTFEDEEGRNGLHCLAELDLEPSEPTEASAPSSPTSEKKRKRSQSENADEPTPVERRANYLANLLACQKPEVQAEFDMNQYSKAGHTPLMVFAMHLTDAADKSGLHTARIIDLLLSNRAWIDMRNRQGETALLMAARAGNKHVVSKLLDCGANLYARDKDGRWIMQVMEDAATHTRDGLASYARLEATKTALANVVMARGILEPGFLDEWRRPLNTPRA